jgi:hypothetical protein
MNENDKLFLGRSICELTQKNIQVNLTNKKQVFQESEKVQCVGYFDCETKKLEVATKMSQRNWLPVFLHEYSHYVQWITKESSFVYLLNNKTLQNHFWHWIQGNEVRSKSEVIDSARAIQQMEYECEKIAFEILEENNLSILKSDYIKFANIDVLFFNVALKYRRWYDTPPHTIPEIMDVIPSEQIEDITKILPEFNELVLKKCYN